MRNTPLIFTSTPAYYLHYLMPAYINDYGASTRPPGIHHVLSVYWITRYFLVTGLRHTIIEIPRASSNYFYACIFKAFDKRLLKWELLLVKILFINFLVINIVFGLILLFITIKYMKEFGSICYNTAIITTNLVFTI